jgi:hypothetical protein
MTCSRPILSYDINSNVRYSGITWLAADKSPGSRVQGWQAIRSRLNATVPNANGAREKAGLFVCEGVRSFFDHVIVLPRDLKTTRRTSRISSTITLPTAFAIGCGTTRSRQSASSVGGSLESIRARTHKSSLIGAA